MGDSEPVQTKEEAKTENSAFSVTLALDSVANGFLEVSSWFVSNEAKASLASMSNFVAFAFLLAIYILFFEPASNMLIESRSLRFKLQGYFVRCLERLLNLVYNRAFIYEITGAEEINAEALGVVLSNHQGFLDYLTIAHLASKCGIDNSTFFFVWKHCVRLPSLQVLYNFWRKKTDWRIPKIVQPEVFASVLESPWKDQGGKWVVIFPEVTPWSIITMLEHRAECGENGCPKLENLLYPRFNAFTQTIGFLRDYPLSDVYDFTITYICIKDHHRIGIPTWQDVMFSNHDWKIKVSVKRTSVAQLPQKEKNLTKWLEKQWFQKDKGLSEVKKTVADLQTDGKTPGEGAPAAKQNVA